MTRAGFALAVLFAINLLNFFDRQILGAVGERIRREWGLGDTALGALGTAFMLLYGFVGVPLGRLADRASRKHILAVGVFIWSLLTGGYVGQHWGWCAALFIAAAPGLLCAAAALFLHEPPRGKTEAGDVGGFAVLMGIGVGVMYAYYSTVYSTIQDIVEPSLRGTAMALYFGGMYLAGASLGPLGTGMISDYFTAQAAGAVGVVERSVSALEPFRANGLHSAMYAIPALAALLAVVLFAASRTVRKDIDALHAWTMAHRSEV